MGGMNRTKQTRRRSFCFVRSITGKHDVVQKMEEIICRHGRTESWPRVTCTKTGGYAYAKIGYVQTCAYFSEKNRIGLRVSSIPDSNASIM